MAERLRGKFKTWETLPGSFVRLSDLLVGSNWSTVRLSFEFRDSVLQGRSETCGIVANRAIPSARSGLQLLVQNMKAHMRTGKKRSSKRTRSRTTPTGRGPTLTNPPQDLASLVRGMYGRVARKLGVDPSYVSRVARGERQSEAVDAALRRSLSDVVRYSDSQRGTKRRSATRKTLRKA